MKNFKKFLTLVLAVMMIVSSVAFSTSAATTKFEDVDADNETLVKAVDLLSYMGVAKGTSETTFGADELVTRQQFALFIYRLMKGGKDAPANASNTTKFTDLEDSTYFYAISWANAAGIVNGKSATTFGPKDPIKLQEAYAMIVRALDWEKENDLVYPYGHIEVAEQAGVELDAGLPSSVGYADELTRGDMAILLYNAFFAKTGVEVVETKEKEIGKGSINPTWVLYEYTTNPRLCETAFDVVEVEYEVIATPHYTKGEVDATYDLGYDAIYVKKTDNDENDDDAPTNAYLTAEDLGVENLDELFLGNVSMFVTLEEQKNDKYEIDEVLFADCNMTKKTVTDLKLGEVSSNKTSSYFTGEEVKLLSGKIIAEGTEEMYAFNAPYSYATPIYKDNKNVVAMYEDKNSENLETLTFEKFDDGEDYYYLATPGTLTTTAVTEPDLKDPTFVFETQGKELIASLYNVYYDGLYEADLYDVDGDGLYDYISYKPYTFFQVDTDEDEYFEDYVDMSDVKLEGNIPYVYVNGATLLGEEFANEDYVVGYFDLKTDVVKVAAVVKPTVATVAGFKKADGTITLSTGDKVDAVNLWKAIATKETYDVTDIVWDLDAMTDSLVTGNSLFENDILDTDESEYYIYEGYLLHSDVVDNNVKFTENLIIPTTLNGEKPVERAPFNPDADNEVYYVYAWVDGVTKYVQVEIDDEVTPFVTDGSTIHSDYADKLCTYTEKDGLYTITPLTVDVVAVDDPTDVISEALSTDVDDLGTSADEGKEDDQVYVDNLGTKITKSGTKFDIGFVRDVDFKSYTKVIIKYTDTKGDVEYIELGAADFTKSLETTLSNMVAIISNNANSESRENLVVLYAETTEDLGWAGKTSKTDLRIVATSEIGQDADGEWRVYYELYDPYTGAKVSDVATKYSEEKAKNLNELDSKLFVKLVDGMVTAGEEAGDTDISIDNVKKEYKIDESNLVWISEVDTTEGSFKAVKYDSSKTSAKDVETYVESDESGIKDIYGREVAECYFAFDKDTVVSVLSYSEMNDNMWKWGTMSLSNMDAVASAKKELLCYNDKALTGKDNDQYTTRYADFVKAYVAVDTDVDTDELPVAEYVIVIVNGKEGTVEYK